MDNAPRRINDLVSATRNTGNQLPTPAPTVKRSKNKMKLFILAAAVVILVGVLTVGGIFMYRSSTAAAIDTAKYQAVFFTNGQVYFGKLQSLNSNYMKLTNIFYLQAGSADSKNPQETTTQTASANVQLIKLGSEVHGPTDEMVINKDQVLFFENLKSDGKVTQSINSFQK